MDNKAMFKLGYGLYVLTAKDGDRDNGCIINTVLQITAAPCRLLITVSKLNYTHDIILNSGLFNISVLTESAPFEIFNAFGYASGRNTDKFADYKFIRRSGNGLLYLTNHTNSYISCQTAQTVDAGTHTLFIADVTDAEVLGGEPSVTYDYYQRNIKKSASVPASDGKPRWKCDICGHIYVGKELPSDYICPICKHGASDFTKIS